jgi:hypothetical protein
MHKRLTKIAAGLALATASLPAQTATTTVGGGFQQAGTLEGSAIARWTVVPFAPRTVPGSPFSGTQERRTVQTLGDGTVLETSEVSTLYRDTDGRTRVETTQQGKTFITITDPVAHTTVRLDPANKIARKLTMPGFGTGVGGYAAAGTPAADKLAAEAGLTAGRRGAVASTAGVADVQSKAALDDLQKTMAEMQARQEATTRTATEDLGMLHQNGVPAQGTRTTLTIPVGQIGNNREIKVVNERWYSQELQMVVKSVNSDPRFGTTTYEMRNISRSNPDSSLFQIPSDYTIQEGGGRGGAVITPPARK